MTTLARINGVMPQPIHSLVRGSCLVSMMAAMVGLVQPVGAVPGGAEARSQSADSLPILLAQDTPVPMTTVKTTQNKVTIRLTNRAGEPVNYQVLGHTSQRSLSNNATVTLRDLPLPANLAFNYVALGQPGVEKFLQAKFSQNATTGVIDVTLNRGTDPETAQTYLGIGRQGGVFLY